MVVTVYTTSVSADKLVKKHQQFILDVLTSKGVEHREIDVSAPENDQAKQFMREHGKAKGAAKVPMPPQIFTDDGTYLGDYDDFVEANESDELHAFLHLPAPVKG